MAKKGVLTTSDYLPYKEYQETINKLHEDKFYWEELYFVVAFATALRVSDVRMLKWKDLLKKPSLIVIERKTEKTRSIPLNEELQDILNELYVLLGSPNKNQYLFLGNKGLPMAVQHINRRLKRIKSLYNLSIENFSTHTFRKTFGRHIWEKHNRSEEALLMLQKILNHSNVGITYCYLGIRNDEIKEFYENLKIR